MKKIITIALILIATISFSQGNTTLSTEDFKNMGKKSIDSLQRLETPLLTIKDIIEFNDFLASYLKEPGRQQVIIAELNRIITMAEQRKKKPK